MKASQCHHSRETLLVFLVTKHNYVFSRRRLWIYINLLSCASGEFAISVDFNLLIFFVDGSLSFPLKIDGEAAGGGSTYLSHVEIIPDSAARCQSMAKLFVPVGKTLELFHHHYIFREIVKIKFKARRIWCLNSCIFNCTELCVLCTVTIFTLGVPFQQMDLC